MAELRQYQGKVVFGLDIGTRSIVGTVGFKNKDRFCVVAQRVKEHETRAMLDGQIHDIGKVGAAIRQVKNELEDALGQKLTDVCIAAAGRVLRTVTTQAEQEFPREKEITEEDVYALAAMGVESAYEEFNKSNDTDMKFYCVGHSVIRYNMNHYPMGNLVGHKARIIGADMIVTFLPEDVVDGLYKAVEAAGLHVANLTLEPIAAIQVAIPEMYRMLNIALVDVGAGTSDISITKDGAIVAYGMIPIAGDSLTEILAQHCLVDFATAEQIKRAAGTEEIIEYKDIMGLTQKVTAVEVLEILKPAMVRMTEQVAACIRELNGDKSVSAVFVVGGGGVIPGYTDMLAEELGIVRERVAVRGEEVMGGIDFMEEGVLKNSLMVTPVGICLNFYEQSNNFIFVTFNNKRIKIYDNSKIAVVDAAMQAEFPNDGLFPRRGRELTFTVGGRTRIVRGLPGETAVITVNGENADIHTPIHANDVIAVTESTTGEAAAMMLSQLPEFNDSLQVIVNDKLIQLPKFASVNGNLKSGYYEIRNRDAIEFLNHYSIKQIAEFMDVQINPRYHLYVNNSKATLDTQVYENFSVIWTLEELYFDVSQEPFYEGEQEPEEETEAGNMQGQAMEAVQEKHALPEGSTTPEKIGMPEKSAIPEAGANSPVMVTVNHKPVALRGKAAYVFVDVFDYIEFDLSKPQGSTVVTLLNGEPAEYMKELKDGDNIDIYWRK